MHDTRLATASRLRVAALAALQFAACGEVSTTEPTPPIELVADVSGALVPADAPPGSVPVMAGLFMSSLQIDSAGAADRARQLVDGTNAILAQL